MHDLRDEILQLKSMLRLLEPLLRQVDKWDITATMNQAFYKKQEGSETLKKRLDVGIKYTLLRDMPLGANLSLNKSKKHKHAMEAVFLQRLQ